MRLSSDLSGPNQQRTMRVSCYFEQDCACERLFVGGGEEGVLVPLLIMLLFLSLCRTPLALNLKTKNTSIMLKV